ncbi:MAG TPA: hypothetical protein VIG45_03020, partial [Erysipelothrix sp.]
RGVPRVLDGLHVIAAESATIGNPAINIAIFGVFVAITLVITKFVFYILLNMVELLLLFCQKCIKNY